MLRYKTLFVLLLLVSPILYADTPGTWKAKAQDIIHKKKSSLVLGVISAHPRECEGLSHLMDKSVKITESGKRSFYRGKLWGYETVLTTSRVGKVAAATTVCHLINEHKVDLILFIGVAGGIDPRLHIGDIVIGNELIQHDLDTRPLSSQFSIPLLGVKELYPDPFLCELMESSAKQFIQNDLQNALSSSTLKTLGITKPKVLSGLIASGDQFISKKAQVDNLKADLPNLLCVEMEGAAVAQVCFEHDIPCAIVRLISDTSNEQAPDKCLQFMKEAAPSYSKNILRQAYKSLQTIQ